jgi:hypothetical protein
MNDHIKEMIEEHNLLVMDGFDDCIDGIVYGKMRELVVVYDREKVIEKIMTHGMTYADAEEYHEYNQADAWVGDTTPMFIIK